ncbi:nucleoside 2-deoxyribosyltransferase domain-containing protein [Chitinophaga japonensis]|uniref:Nucleoside 2-deoxyribosyltransferase-like protein n=1 Tax=Chitinophaga japonensis TaxID=104662 RepID=A0A562T2V1_CHIJA|nr:nucleoside 2-deoxyribosyltransferase domain-containing protein [Chitinophaga japonensis]TWI87949.1 nucleoside 2-deoxyribosyltransferase-like protein [Chitinophaga japonensis]
MHYISPADIANRDTGLPSIFLAGSIDMGKANKWQADFINQIQAYEALKNVNIFNPRREDWNSSTPPHADNPQFHQQVNWELNALEAADYIVMRFEASSLAPVTLLELGLYATSGKLLVSCAPEFWRKGNVDIICRRYDIPMFDNVQEIISHLNFLLTQ